MSTFPGLKAPYLALTLLSIEPALQGALIAGPAGTGKSRMARLARKLFPANSPFINVPLSCSLSQLVGGIDIERSRQAGKLIAQPGLLARAHGGVLYIDEINLLPNELSTVIMQALTQGEVQLEREGLSYTYPARFSIIGTFNPAERELPAPFYDRLAFLVFSETISHLGWRMYVTARHQHEMDIPEDVINRVARAREILPQVTITDKQIEKLCQYAQELGVEGNRAEILAVRCAKANAALNFREPVTHEDLYLAVRLVYMPRLGNNALVDSDLARKINAPESRPQKKDQHPNTSGEQSQQGHTNSGRGKKHESEGRQKEEENTGTGSGKKARPHDLIPETDEEEFSAELPRFKGSTAGTPPAGKHQLAKNLQRGRHVGSVPGLPGKGRLDLLATLKSAALNNPLQPPGDRIKIRKTDFHVKKYQQRSGLLFIFAVDGSGSMAINHFEAAKGAALQLLEKAYVYRDQVALIYFRHKQAQLLLPPGASVTSAAAALRKIRAGGKTPLGTALLKTIELVKKNKAQKATPGTVLVLFTDGKANQPHRDNDGRDPQVAAMEELKSICPALQEQLTACLVFDTRMGRQENPYGIELADMLGASYIRLPKATTEEVMAAVNRQTKSLR